MSTQHNSRRYSAKFWILILAYWAVTGVVIALAFTQQSELPGASELQQLTLLPLWAVVLTMMSIILTGLIADVRDDFSLFWVDLALLVFFGGFKWVHHLYLTEYWNMAPAPEGVALLAVWPWVFVILFVFIAFASLVRRAKPGVRRMASRREQ